MGSRMGHGKLLQGKKNSIIKLKAVIQTEKLALSLFEVKILNYGTIDIWGQIILCFAVTSCIAYLVSIHYMPVHYPHCNNQKCLLTLSRTPWGAKLPLIKSLWSPMLVLILFWLNKFSLLNLLQQSLWTYSWFSSAILCVPTSLPPTQLPYILSPNHHFRS